MNLTTVIQSEISQILSTEDLKWLCEDSRNIEFEVKDSLSRQGISPVVVVTELDYQGHNSELEFYDASVELQVAENPAVSRFYKGGKSAYDVVLDAVHRLCGYRSGIFGNWCPGTVTQQIENNLVVVRAEIFGTYAYKPTTEPGWNATGAYAGRFEFAIEDADGTKHYNGPNGMTFAIDPQPGGWSFIFKVPDVIEYNTGMIADTLPNLIIFDHEGNHTEFVPDVKSQHYNWQASFEQPAVHEDCMIEWMYSNIEPVQGLGNLMTHHFRSEDKLVTLKVVELPSRPQQPDKDRFELQVGQEGAQSIFDVDRSATSVADTYYQATLSKIEPNLT